MRKNVKRIGGGLVVISIIMFGGVAACAETAPPDGVGLYYMLGPSDGNHFGHCFDPGSADDPIWNNEIHYLPTSLRTWNIAPAGGDTSTPITVNSAPEDGQPSGVQVNLWMQTNFSLNTFCGDNNEDANSPIVQFWEKLGRRYEADTTEGWKTMLMNTIVTALETSSRSVVRGYTADSLVSGLVREEVQQKIATLFQTEILRVTGAEYFCAPTFSRVGVNSNAPDCGNVEILLKDVDYTSPLIQDARDKKQAAIEEAAALVAQAKGQLEAANAQKELLNNPGWLELEKARILADACKESPSCTIVFGGSGIIATK